MPVFCKVLCYFCSFNRVLALDENSASAHHYLGRIYWLQLLDDMNNVGLREACLRHLIQVCDFTTDELWNWLICGVVQWCSAKALDLRSIGLGFNSHRNKVVHTYVPRSPSSITWYWSKDGDVLFLGRWLQFWQKVIQPTTCGLVILNRHFRFDFRFALLI